jgi:caffeoyl-CoA O-methyltransferase
MEHLMLTLVPEAIENYARAHSVAESPTLRALRQATEAETELPQMLSGPLVGQTLRLLCQLCGARRAVEVGTFTGYASLWIASGLAAGGKLITLDVDETAPQIGQRHWSQDPLGALIDLRIGDAQETLRGLEGGIDFAFIDADKAGYIDYYELLMQRLHPGGLIVADNVLWSGRVLAPEDASDRALAAYAAHVSADSRCESLLLTIRDGLLVSRKKVI